MVGRDIAGMEHASEVHTLDDVGECRAVDFRDDLRARDAAGIEAHQHVFLIDARQRGHGVHLCNALLGEQLLVRAVSVDDRGLGQALCQRVAHGGAGLDDLHARAEIQHLPREVVGDAPAAKQHHALDGVRLHTDLVEELCGELRACHHADAVARQQGEAAVGDVHLVLPALHNAHKRAGLQAAEVRELHAVEYGAGVDAHLVQLDAAL